MVPPYLFILLQNKIPDSVETSPIKELSKSHLLKMATLKILKYNQF